MTAEQEKEVMDGLASLKSTIATLSPIASKVPELEKALKEKDAEIVALKQGHATLSQESMRSSLKTLYPDVPEDVLLSLPEADRAKHGKTMQDHISKLKVAPKAAETNPQDINDLWMRAGGISPTDEAALAAQRVETEKSRQESKKNGDVFGMLHSRSADIIAHLKRGFASAKA